MKPEVPEGTVVEFEYGTVASTHDGRALEEPHRFVSAILFDEADYPALKTILAHGSAICKEGPTVEEARTRRRFRPDQYAKKVGRDIALGRAVKSFENGTYRG